MSYPANPMDLPKRWRAAARTAVVIAGAGSVGFMLYAGRRNGSTLLLVLMAIWVTSPFVVLLWASAAATRWSRSTQSILNAVMLAVALGSLAVYGINAVRPISAKGAFIFVVVPPMSWLLTAIGGGLAKLSGGGRDT
ncbi:MAG: hypothetical protein ABJF01_25880 [bacterium]